MSESQKYLTSEKIQEFKEELNLLKTEKRKQVAENLEYAKKLGDLSENAEYHEARQQQAEVEDRISHLEDLLKRAIVVDGRKGDIVDIGSTVEIKKSGDSVVNQYKIVGSEEADMNHGKISNLSPLGSSVIGKKKGESFSVTTPKGEVSYNLVSIK